MLKLAFFEFLKNVSQTGPFHTTEKSETEDNNFYDMLAEKLKQMDEEPQKGHFNWKFIN